MRSRIVFPFLFLVGVLISGITIGASPGKPDGTEPITQSSTPTTGTNGNFERRETIKALSSALASEAKRADALELRIGHLEEMAKPDKEESLGSQVLHIAISILEKILADAVGFAVLAIIFAAIVKHEFINTVKEGLRSIGTVFAESFVSNVVPEIINFRQDAITVLRTRSFFYERATDISASAAVDKELGDIEEQLPIHGFAWAEEKLVQLSEKHRTEFKIVARLFQLYSDSLLQEGAGDSTSLAKKAIRFLESRANEFSKQTDYYYFLAQAHCKLNAVDPGGMHFRAALKAANNAIDLEPKNPRWLSLRGLVHDMFSSPIEAIPDTEKALTLALELNDATNVARAKNNLAYYYAELRQWSKKPLAIEYAKAACEFDREHRSAEHISLDTLGYVLMKFAETKEELEEALETLTKASKVDSQDADIRGHMTDAKRLLDAMVVSDC